MKKLLFAIFSLFLVLPITNAQTDNLKTLIKTVKPKAEKLIRIPRNEDDKPLSTIQAEPSMIRTEGTELQQTYYDWQSNDGARTWTHVWNNGKVDFAFTTAADASFTSRGTGIVTYNSNTGQWSAIGGRVENEKTGFGSIAQYGANGLVVAAHTATDCRVYVTNNRDAISTGSMTVTSVLDNTYEPCWANVMTSGANRNIIHVIATASSTSNPILDGVTDPLIYFRSMDGGQTWDKQNVILPFLTAEYGIHWNSNCAYWMETTENNRLTLIVNNAWSDGMAIYSDDNGETWNRKVFYSHPNIMGVDTADWFFYPRWTSALWDGDNLKLAYEWNGSTGEAGSGSYYPGIGGVAYWSSDLPYNAEGQAVSAIPGNLTPGEPFIMDTAYLYQDIYASMWWWSDATHEPWPEYIGYMVPLDNETGEVEDYNTAEEMNITGGNGEGGNHAHYNQGVAAWPVLCRVPDSEGLVAVWAMLDENCHDGAGLWYYHLFANYSPDGGFTWGNMRSLCAGDDYWMYQNLEMTFPQAAVINGQLVVVAQVDEGTGSFVQSDDTNGADNWYVGYVYNLSDLFSNDPVPTNYYTISATASPTNGGTVSGAGTYAQGITCTLSATPANGYSFVKWTKNGTQVSDSPHYSFTVTGDASFVALFQADTYTITAQADPTSGGSASVSNGGSFNYGQTCTLTATPADGYTFVNWTKNGSSVSDNASYSFQVTESAAFVAHFRAVTHTIQASPNPSNGGSVSGTGSYQHNAFCTLIANPSSDYVFRNWTENELQVSTNSSYTFKVLNDRTLVANFDYSPNMATISASAVPNDGGTVSGDGNYAIGESCTLTATPNTGYTFLCWKKDGEQVSTNTSHTFQVSGSASFEAHFQAITHTVALNADPADGGSVTGGGSYPYGNMCTVNATPAEGFSFVRWSENGTEVTPEALYQFTVTQDRTLTAVFRRNGHTIYASSGANGTINPSGDVIVQEGDDQTFTMVPNDGYKVSEVYVDGAFVGSLGTFTFSNVTEDHSIYVSFAPNIGVEENSDSHIVVHPNPTDGIANVHCNDAKEIRVYNILGVLVKTIEATGEDTQIDLGKCKSGLYILNIIQDSDVINMRIIKR